MRTYTKDKKEYFSVTSLVGRRYPFNKESFAKYCAWKGLDPQRIGDLSTLMGTKVSDWIENKDKGLEFLDPPVIGDREKGLKSAVDRFFNDHKVVETERVVYCDELKYAGTLDGIVEYNGTEYLMDWKTYGAWKGKYSRDTGKIKKVRMQLNMYNNALGGNRPLALVVFKVDGTYEIEEIKYDDEWKEWLNNFYKEM